ncbi:hypothetical protein WG66_002699 [Moniliophthora roreri]|nr:hypothetical protein WG66_002699 [Moniliophthora roreri]
MLYQDCRVTLPTSGDFGSILDSVEGENDPCDQCQQLARFCQSTAYDYLCNKNCTFAVYNIPFLLKGNLSENLTERINVGNEIEDLPQGANVYTIVEGILQSNYK